MNRRKFINKLGILTASASTGAVLIPPIIGLLGEGKIEKTLSSTSDRMVITNEKKTYWIDYEQFNAQQEWEAQKEKELNMYYRSPAYEV
jgi:hypothetical protein